MLRQSAQASDARWIWAIALLMVATLLPAPAHADVKAGIDAWNRGEYRKAVEEWRPAALAGDADAQFDLGEAYKLGRGVPVDFGLAEEWFGRAARQGHQQGETNYGLILYQNGKHDEALPWLRKAVERGEPRAQLVLGTMLFNGDSVEKEPVRAYALVTRAAAAGLPAATKALAQMDSYLPAETRIRGLAMSRDYASKTPAPAADTTLAMEAPAPERSPTPVHATPAAVVPPAEKPAAAPPPRATVPRPALAAVAPPRPAAVTGASAKSWRVQVGAFRDAANGRALWQKLQAQLTGAGALQPFYIAAGGVTRLQLGPLASREDAARLCTKLSAGGTPCLPVAP